MPPPTTCIDQDARDLARQALAEIRTHAAVCVEADKANDRFRDDMRKAVKDIQGAYETGMMSMTARIGSAVDGMRASQSKDVEDQREVNIQLFNRFWGLVLGWATAATSLSGFLGGKLLHLF